MRSSIAVATKGPLAHLGCALRVENDGFGTTHSKASGGFHCLQNLRQGAFEGLGLNIRPVQIRRLKKTHRLREISQTWQAPQPKLTYTSLGMEEVDPDSTS